MKIKTGDMVRILAGKDRGKTGKVLQVFATLNKVVVEGANLAKKHLKGRGNQKGQIIDYPAPLHCSNVTLMGKDGVTGRVGYRTATGSKAEKQRVIRKARHEHETA